MKISPDYRNQKTGLDDHFTNIRNFSIKQIFYNILAEIVHN